MAETRVVAFSYKERMALLPFLRDVKGKERHENYLLHRLIKAVELSDEEREERELVEEEVALHNWSVRDAPKDEAEMRGRFRFGRDWRKRERAWEARTVDRTLPADTIRMLIEKLGEGLNGAQTEVFVPLEERLKDILAAKDNGEPKPAATAALSPPSAEPA